jgi:hypothetical protein
VGHCTWGTARGALHVGHCTWGTARGVTWGGPPGRLHERSETSLHVGHCTWGTVRGAVLRAAFTSEARRPLRAKLRSQRARSPAPRSGPPSRAKRGVTVRGALSVGRSSGPPSRAQRDVHSARSRAASGPGAPLHDKRAPQELPGPICPGRFIAAFKLRSNYPTI